MTIFSDAAETRGRSTLRAWADPMKHWDVFVSHASADKQAAVLPLVQALQRSGVRVWLDAFEIGLGDGLRKKIDEGLGNCRFGLLVLSQAFFAKRWPNDELDALYSKPLIPVLYGIDVEQLRAWSPLLAGKLVVSLDGGVDAVAAACTEHIFAAKSGGTTSARDFAKSLADAKTVAELAPTITDGAAAALVLRRPRKGDQLKANVELGRDVVNFSIGQFQPSTGRCEDWTLGLLGSPTAMLFDDSGQPSAELLALIDRERQIRSWVRDNYADARRVLPAIRLDYRALLVAGRRLQPVTHFERHLASVNDTLMTSRVRTYDAILDALLQRDSDHD
jgi:hypothetical protein